ncbi:hypothetical protein ACH5RR_029905 [Cinchona calisaya]|uniref:F-box domain-containing protein n=1 Tax=Cinchona calisaya TaxID=153742 RepID=A0ABD2YW91_9GENT
MVSKRRRPGKNGGISCRISDSILDVPLCIWIEIFSRLPISTILRCKSVCKDWYTFISSDIDFANDYSSNAPFTSLVISIAKSPLCLLELKADYNYCRRENWPKSFPIPSWFSRGYVTVFGSCKGLLCLSHCLYAIEEYGLYVCNPLLGEYALLPHPKPDRKVSEEAYGFGFCPETGEYKVLRILMRGWCLGQTEAQVCTVGVDDDWRVLMENAPFPHARKLGHIATDRHRICEVTVNGALHWITEDLVRPDFLYSFDIGEEKVRSVPQPRGVVVRNGWTSLGVLRGCLCIYQSASPPQFDIWWMKEYGVVESWTKESILYSSIPHSPLDPYYPIVVWKDGEVLIHSDLGSLLSYNPEEEISTDVTLNRKHCRCFSAVPYVPCFLSLKDVMKTGQVEGVRGKLNFVMEPKKSKGASANKHWNATTAIQDLPTYILVDIFSRIPRTTIISMKRICKTWYNLISDPHFGNTYFATQCTVSLVLSGRNFISSFPKLRTDCDYNAQTNREKILITPADFSGDRGTLLGSCNGLICFSIISNSKQSCTLYIFNPQLKECARLPQPKVEKIIRDDVYGFGFCPATGHYKVLRILTKKWQRGKSEAQVHTIGIDDCWRNIGENCHFPMAKKWPEHLNKARICEVTLMGALHWIVEDSHAPEFLYSFDMDEEEVCPIPPPPIVGERNCWTSLGVLRDCLCLFHSICPLNIDIWWMRDYGVVSSWTKESILADYIPVGLEVRAVLPILVWKNDEILMSTDCGPLISYCPRDEKCTEVGIEHDVEGYSTAAPYFPSFLSLKAAMKGGHLEVVKLK